MLCALLTKEVSWDRVRVLPSEYSYPLHLHHQVPPKRQARSLNDLICPVYERTFQHPATLHGLAVDEPLDTWLRRLQSSVGRARTQ